MSTSDLNHKKSKNKKNIFDKTSQNSFKSNEQMLKIPCYYHQGSTITNFCTDPNCLMPLCPLCIEIHQNEQLGRLHVANFEPIENTRSKAIWLTQQLLSEKDMCEKQIKDISNIAKQNEKEILKIVEVKEKQLMDLIYSYFQEVKYNVKAAFSNYSDSDIEKEVKHAKDELEGVEKQLKKQNKHLKKDKKILPEIINLFQPSYAPIIRKDIQDIQIRLQFLAVRLPQIEINDLYLQNISSDLLQLIKFKNPIQNNQQPLFGKNSEIQKSRLKFFSPSINSKNFKHQFTSTFPIRSSAFASTQRSQAPVISLWRPHLASMSPQSLLTTTISPLQLNQNIFRSQGIFI